jgi:hypothetical protein
MYTCQLLPYHPVKKLTRVDIAPRLLPKCTGLRTFKHVDTGENHLIVMGKKSRRPNRIKTTAPGETTGGSAAACTTARSQEAPVSQTWRIRLIASQAFLNTAQTAGKWLHLAPFTEHSLCDHCGLVDACLHLHTTTAMILMICPKPRV